MKRHFVTRAVDLENTVDVELRFAVQRQFSVYAACGRQLAPLPDIPATAGDSRFRLHWLHDKRRNLACLEFGLNRGQVAKGNGFGFRQERAKPIAPKGVIHVGECAACQPVESAARGDQAGTASVGSREFDGRLHAFTSGAAEKHLVQAAARQTAQALANSPACSETWFSNMAGP